MNMCSQISQSGHQETRDTVCCFGIDLCLPQTTHLFLILLGPCSSIHVNLPHKLL